MGFLFLLFPIIEIYCWYIFIEMYSVLDAFLFALSGFLLGSYIVLMQGKSVLQSLQTSLLQNQVPSKANLHQVMVLLGGLLILLPGVLSKFIGVFFILPGSRHLLLIYMKTFLVGKIKSGNFRVYSNFGMNIQKDNPTERDVVDITPKSIKHIDKQES